jgi:hypothetical protein
MWKIEIGDYISDVPDYKSRIICFFFKHDVWCFLVGGGSGLPFEWWSGASARGQLGVFGMTNPQCSMDNLPISNG